MQTAMHRTDIGPLERRIGAEDTWFAAGRCTERVEARGVSETEGFVKGVKAAEQRQCAADVNS